MDQYEYDKYVSTVETAKDTLDKYGIAIIPDVLNEEECIATQEGMWDTLQHITQTWDKPIRRDDPASWRELKRLFPKHGMLLQNWEVGHAQFVWNIRQNPKVANVFAHLWKVPKESLLVSFDGVSFSLPPEKTNMGWYRETKYHTDQSPLSPHFDCIQGWVNGFDTNKGDATLAFLEGSHKYHKDLHEKFGVNEKDDWYRIDDLAQLEHFIKVGCTPKRIKCPKGSLVLWDSRTLHTGSEPIKGREKPNFRSCVYVCYRPRTNVSNIIMNKRKKAFEEKRMTSHNPIRSSLFPKNPRTYGAPMPEITELPTPTLTSFGKKLVGY
jgi:ectoine hydroxylase-related dioxygenase (phytanoyl-CoA dioxygenase family)